MASLKTADLNTLANCWMEKICRQGHCDIVVDTCHDMYGGIHPQVACTTTLSGLELCEECCREYEKAMCKHATCVVSLAFTYLCCFVGCCNKPKSAQRNHLNNMKITEKAAIKFCNERRGNATLLDNASGGHDIAIQFRKYTIVRKVGNDYQPYRMQFHNRILVVDTYNNERRGNATLLDNASGGHDIAIKSKKYTIVRKVGNDYQPCRMQSHNRILVVDTYDYTIP